MSKANRRKEAVHKAAQDKYSQASSEWVQSFAMNKLKVLIVCRGPVRKEAMDVFDELSIKFGILLSAKDSVIYPQCLAPELRFINDRESIHRVPDYSGASAEERRERIKQIIQIGKDHKYTHIFAGYGFMAEDAEFVAQIEKAGLNFMGPTASVHEAAGAKDSAKKLARSIGVSVTPGLDNISAYALLSKAGGDVDGLKRYAKEHNIKGFKTEGDPLDVAQSILDIGYQTGAPLLNIFDLKLEARKQITALLEKNPGKRFRFKYIGGGGGKGQRIVSAVNDVDEAVFQVLNESKATGDGDNKNFLIELNIENTRHNEIQLLGNGEWSIALGGRDCSLQMHEQKLVELSITDELYATEIDLAAKQGRKSIVEQLEKDKKTLQEMESQAEKFGEAVGLNSASTFECIVSGNSFYFMEVNTRIQVEHRVTEMVYELKFVNPADAEDYFIVDSLVEAMALCSAHGKRLPKPIRLPNSVAGGEIRLNATNDALQPAAGGTIQRWSDPIDTEIRDDQGICANNPDTGMSVRYHLAGAYDSNIALLVSYGRNRRELLNNLADICRQTELRGDDLYTNLNFHYGILNFCLAMHPMVKPDTRFVLPYLAAVGNLAICMESIDLNVAWDTYLRKVREYYGSDGEKVFAQKLTLLTRPIEYLLKEPHRAMGWLTMNHNRAFHIDGKKIQWLRNPWMSLADLFKFLHLEERESASPAQKMWQQDAKLLQGGLEFYEDLEAHLKIDTEKHFFDSVETSTHNKSDEFLNLNRRLYDDEGEISVNGVTLDADLSKEIHAAHRGYQLGTRLLNILIHAGIEAGIFEFRIGDKLEPIVPEQFMDPDNQKRMIRALAPPPKASSNEIVAVTGGMFYAQETPTSPPYLEAGHHFNAGDPIYLIEVMKMFNKIQAEFAGTVDEVLVQGEAGTVVRKGQPLFKVTPDEVIHIETDEERDERRKVRTRALINMI